MAQPNQQRALAPGGGAIYVDPNPFVTPQTSWSQTDWYVDPINGIDTNSGADQAHPVKTIVGGVVAKWGTPAPTLTQNTTVHVLNSETVGQEAVVLAPVLVGGVQFAIIGTPAATGATFHPTGVTAKNRATPQLLQLTGMPAGAAAGTLVHNQTHDSYAFIDSIAAGVATMTQPLDTTSLTTVTTANSAAPSEVDTWAAGDTYQLYTLPTLNLKVLAPQGGDALNNAQTSPVAWVQAVHIPDVSGSIGYSAIEARTFTSSMIFSMCSFDVSFTGWAPQSTNRFLAACLGCYFNGGVATDGWYLVGGSCQSNSGLPVKGSLQNTGLDGDIIMHGQTWVTGGFNIFGLAYFANALTVYNAVMSISPDYYASAQLWGSGTINVEHHGAVLNDGAGLWANTLTLSAITLDGGGTGSSYAAGAWTSGIAITGANLDTHAGLQNPVTGTRYATT